MIGLDKLKSQFLGHISFAVLVPAFFVAFCIVYNPFDIQDYLSFGDKGFSFHIVMLACITLLTIVLSRAIFLLFDRHFDFETRYYLLWIFFEILAIALFWALYVAIFMDGAKNYLTCAYEAVKLSYLILIYPYLFILIVQYHRRCERTSSSDVDELIKFHDEHQRLKLTIASSSILFISAEFNYVKIHYVESGKLKDYMLRNSMKSVQNSVENYGLVRCQRSYFVNPKHVKVLRKDKEGFIFAELDVQDVPPVPVSKSYYESLAGKL